jgi:hypothetical protein
MQRFCVKSRNGVTHVDKDETFTFLVSSITITRKKEKDKRPNRPTMAAWPLSDVSFSPSLALFGFSLSFLFY